MDLDPAKASKLSTQMMQEFQYELQERLTAGDTSATLCESALLTTASLLMNADNVVDIDTQGNIQLHKDKI